MPVLTADIKFKFSVKTGAAGNSTVGTAAGSLGKYLSTTQITDDTLNNLFDDVSGDENASSVVDYRCIFIHNTSASTWTAPTAWLESETSGGATIAIGVDTTVASAAGSASAQALQVTDELTAPAGVTFSSPTTKAAGVALGDLTAGQCRAIWIRRTAANTAALANDGVVLAVEGS